MPFTDKTIFNIRARNSPPTKGVDSRTVSDSSYIFRQPFRTMAEPKKDFQSRKYFEKIVRLLQQAAANKATN